MGTCKTFLCVVAGACCATASPSWAWQNSCNGVISANGNIHDAVSEELNNYKPGEMDCSFDPKSAIGKRIVKICPVGTFCLIELPDNTSGNPIRRIYEIKKGK